MSFAQLRNLRASLARLIINRICIEILVIIFMVISNVSIGDIQTNSVYSQTEQQYICRKITTLTVMLAFNTLGRALHNIETRNGCSVLIFLGLYVTICYVIISNFVSIYEFSSLENLNGEISEVLHYFRIFVQVVLLLCTPILCLPCIIVHLINT